MPTKLGGRPANTEETKEGRAYLRRLLYPAIEKLENILNNSKQVDEVRKTASYIIDHNLGRAAFQVYGQLDFHKTEVVLKAFLAGDLSQLPQAQAQLEESTPGFAQVTLCEPDITQAREETLNEEISSFQACAPVEATGGEGGQGNRTV